MVRVSLIVMYVLLIGAVINAAQEPAPAVQALPAGQNVVVYHRQGMAPTVHVHGAVGDVHIWFVEEGQPSAAAQFTDEEKRKLAAIKRAVNDSHPMPK